MQLGGTVPPFKMHPRETVPPFKIHPGGTVSLFKMYPGGTLNFYKLFFELEFRLAKIDYNSLRPFLYLSPESFIS